MAETCTSPYVHRGDWILVMEPGNLAVLGRAGAEIISREVFAANFGAERSSPGEYGRVRLPHDAAAPQWVYALQHQVYETPLGRCILVWPAGMPAPPPRYVAANVDRLRPPALRRAH